MAQLVRALSGQPQSPLQQNAPYVQPGQHNYNTPLAPLDEMAFRQWVGQNNVPFDPNAQASDYDMRGFYQGLQQQNPRATAAVNQNDNMMHYPDYWKTPMHQSFSNESQWATPQAPQWISDSQLAAPNGRILFDEKKPR